MKRFLYGVCEWSVRARDEALCRLAAEQKLDCLQLGVGEEVFTGRGLGSIETVKEYKKAADRYGNQINSLSPQFVDKYSFTNPQSNQEETLVAELIEKTIDLSGVFGCKVQNRNVIS